jgi:hypothetical protein
MGMAFKKIYHNPSLLYLMLLFFILQVFVSFLTYNHSLTFDEAIWQYIGRNWFRNGLVPYTGGVDNKSPLIYAIFGLSDRFFGINYWLPRLSGICFQSAGLFFVYKIAKHFSGEFAGKLSITIYGLSLLWHATGGKYVSYTESYAVAFIVAAVYTALAAKTNRRLFISGILAGAGLLFRFTAFFGISAMLIYLVVTKKWLSLFFISGVAISIAAIGMLLSFSGIQLHDLLVYTFADNFGPGSVTDHSIFWKMDSLFTHAFFSEFVLFLPGLAAYFFIKQKNKFMILWLIAEFAGISAIGAFSNQHFKNLLPSLSIINALVITHLAENSGIAQKKILVIIWLCFFPKLLEPLVVLKQRIFGSNQKQKDYCVNPDEEPDDYSKRKMGLWIRSNTQIQEMVLVAGYGAIVQAYSERLSPSVYFNLTQTKAAKTKLNADITNKKPGMILVPLSEQYFKKIDPETQNSINELIAGNYYFQKCMFGYNIYIIKNRHEN